MERIYDDPRGRPKDAETKRRHREFLRVLSETGSFEEAIEQSGMATSRLPKILDAPSFRQAFMNEPDTEARAA